MSDPVLSESSEWFTARCELGTDVNGWIDVDDSMEHPHPLEVVPWRPAPARLDCVLKHGCHDNLN